MISRNGNKNFFVAHYEWVALVVAVLALAGAGALFVTSGGDEDATADVSSYGAKKDGEGVKSIELADYDRATGLIRKAPQVTELPTKGANFLASEARAFCDFCGVAMDASATNCAACGKAPVKEQAASFDSDDDGMPDEWEVKAGLNPRDAADAELDADGDGFTNLEEFQAKTDPKDKSSHPDYLDSLELRLPLKETTLPFVLNRAMPIPGGFRLFFYDPKAKNNYGKLGLEYSVKTGEAIGKTGYVAKGFEKKSEKMKIAGSTMTREVDVSVATVERKVDGREISLVVGDKKHKAVDVQAHLVYTRGGQKEFDVVPGDRIELNGTAYVVKSITTVGKGAAVVVEPAAGGAARTLRAE